VPPITPAAWTSFLTGKNPGQHGVLGFTERAESQFRDLEGHMVSSRSIQAHTLWEILSQKNRQVISVNVPITYPAFPIRGILISGLLAPNEESDFVYPPGIRRVLFDELGGYKVDDNPQQADIAQDRRFWLWKYFDIEETRHRAVRHLMRHYPWDVFGVVYSLPDRIQHLTWQYRNRRGEQDAELAAAITRAYERMDAMVGELADIAGPETTVVLLSDHGFGPMGKVFFINKWLYDEGYLKLKWPSLASTLHTLRWERRTPTVEKVLRKLGLGSAVHRLSPSILGWKAAYVRPAFRPPRPQIDWARTRAFGANYGIYITTGGTEKRRGMRAELREKLMALRDPEDGREVTDLVLEREAVYSGPLSERAPDLVYRLQEMTMLQNDGFTRGPTFVPRHVGTHRMEGIFMARGKAILRGSVIQAARIIDVAPTILHLLGLPVPEDMDGKVLTGALTAEFTQSHPVRFEAPRPFLGRGRAEDVFTPEEDERIRGGLRALGYLE
jgi:predicted AlkP superfamily phosphohydrolase/phosphomutase